MNDVSLARGARALSSKRLQLMADMVHGDYSHIWDCCCDHGLLGFEIMKRQSSKVHFVDCEKRLTDALQLRLETYCPELSQWQVHCEDVCQMALPEESKQLVIIAGVGGDTCIQMVQSILERHPEHRLDFMLCPVRQLELVRFSLASSAVGLLSDTFVEERGRYYEVLYLRQNHSRPLGVIAQDLWQPQNSLQRRYIEKRIDYLSHPSKTEHPERAAALRSYRALLQSDLFES